MKVLAVLPVLDAVGYPAMLAAAVTLFVTGTAIIAYVGYNSKAQKWSGLGAAFVGVIPMATGLLTGTTAYADRSYGAPEGQHIAVYVGLAGVATVVFFQATARLQRKADKWRHAKACVVIWGIPALGLVAVCLQNMLNEARGEATGAVPVVVNLLVAALAINTIAVIRAWWQALRPAKAARSKKRTLVGAVLGSKRTSAG